MTENLREDNNAIKPFTWWERLKYTFVAPNKVFENLAHHPKVLFPILTFIIGITILTFLRLDLYKEFLIQTMMEQLAAQGLDAPMDIESLANMQVYVSMFFMAVMPLVVWIFKSAMVNGIASLMGGEGSFKEVFSVIAYAYMPVLLGQAIVTIISLIIGQFNILTSLAIVLPESMTGSFLYNLLSQFDIFIIWYQILAIIGISHVYDFSKKKAAIPVLVTWFVWILITVGLATLGTALTGSI